MKKIKKKFWNFKKINNKTGELMLYGEIANETWWGDEVTPKDFKKELDNLGDIDTLNVYINSPGGDVFAGQAIHSMLKRHKAHVNVYIDGLAASIASVVAMAGDKVIMPKNAMMMIHNPWTIAIGNAEDFRKLADDLDQIRESIVEAYKRKTILDEDKIKELMDNETWLTAEECKEYGFADELEEEKEIAASINTNMLSKYKNTPKEIFESLIKTKEKAKKNDDKEKINKLKAKLALELEL
ncbi:head maturation protease, ClpP-related [Caloranaerobacter sp. DY30410]|uniref:head maturation protease, ClpP-related n=1 Tax=Caloranaerobacter sp. DY30410 TaxID=3238305 RepID=UPI003CFEC64A